MAREGFKRQSQDPLSDAKPAHSTPGGPGHDIGVNAVPSRAKKEKDAIAGMRDFNLDHDGPSDVAPPTSHVLSHVELNGRNGYAKIQHPRNGNGVSQSWTHDARPSSNGRHTNGRSNGNGNGKVGEIAPFPTKALTVVPSRHPLAQSTLQSTTIAARDVHKTLSKHMLVDGFDMVIDLQRSRGARLYCAKHDRWFLDFFSFFVSLPIGMNHPHMTAPDFMQKLAYVAVNKPSNSDVYTVEMAEFLETFSRVAIPEYLPHAFFIEGGAAAVENALKSAFDWKIRKNFAKGHKSERGTKILHFERAFHGRSGYTLSLTNTDPAKTQYFPKFEWPRVLNPSMEFPLTEENLKAVELAEKESIRQIEQSIKDNPDDIAGLIIEPIQGEGGDHHFRKEFFQKLRDICDENEILFIMDEVQTGIGLTGKMWAHQHFVQPDIISFGKKSQVCGILAGPRVSEVDDHVFSSSSRINSTWGGSLVDMVRFQRYLEIIEAEELVENARTLGAYLLANLRALEAEFPRLVSNTRGRGLFCALDLPSGALRDELRQLCFKHGMLILPSGSNSLRFRPCLDIRRHEIDEAIHIIRKSLQQLTPRVVH